MTNPELNCIYCQICNCGYLVGFGGISIDGKGSGGTFAEVPYLAIGCNELKGESKSIKEGDDYHCPVCHFLCKVENAKPVVWKK